MPTQVGSTVTDFDNAMPASITTSYTQATGSDLVLVVKIGTEDDVTHDSVTFDGNGLTKQVEQVGTNRRTSIWTLVNPPVTTANIVFTPGANADIALIATSWQDVHQTTPVSNSASNSGNSTNPSVVVPSAAGELVLDAVNSDSDGSDPTVGAGQSEIADVDVTADFRFFASEQAGAAPNVTMDWTTVSAPWASCGISLQPATPPVAGAQTHDMLV